MRKALRCVTGERGFVCQPCYVTGAKFCVLEEITNFVSLLGQFSNSDFRIGLKLHEKLSYFVVTVHKGEGDPKNNDFHVT